MTCRSEHWQRIQSELIGCVGKKSNVEACQIGYLEEAELDLVYLSFPKIKVISRRAQLGELIKIPKIIDLLAKGIENKTLNENVSWIGETDLINWLWESIKNSCEDGYSLIVLIQKIAELQADQAEFATPINKLDLDEISHLRALDNGGICVEDNGRISFQHDLYADWARYQNILANESDIQSYLKDRSLNPFWHKAIRLYGQNLIEQKSDASDWCNTINRHNFLKDYLLDSIIFAANSRALLEKAYAFLIKNNGELLKRLLKRFLIIATCPNPGHLNIVSVLGKDYMSFASTLSA
jgi:hypothetical protein